VNYGEKRSLAIVFADVITLYYQKSGDRVPLTLKQATDQRPYAKALPSSRQIADGDSQATEGIAGNNTSKQIELRLTHILHQ
jgi:hypothetical protein